MSFQELTDEEWAQLSALLSNPPDGRRVLRRGRPCAPARTIANAILWLLSTCQPWSKLPPYYPSQPTCRRRLTEWHTNGTLAEMIRLLTLNGRSLSYVPETPRAAAKPVQSKIVHRPPETFEQSVFWSSPETWQRGTQQEDDTLPLCSLEPLARITHQLTSPVAIEACKTTSLAKTAEVYPPFSSLEKYNFHSRPDQTFSLESKDCRQPLAGAQRKTSETHNELEPNSRQQMPLWMSCARPRGVRVIGPNGYIIYVVAELVRNGEYRTSVEIVRNGERIERSGLIGPPFADMDTAHQFALERAREWIDQCQLDATRRR
ncbi:transposase [Paraburkholderia sp. JPY465]|uniref:transposase n=1 Tax=Paraburkholderia sp. JPY465 TaxID=3042285 RepID=UPI003D1D3F3D